MMPVTARKTKPKSRPKLRVVQSPKQDCANCPQLRKCWNMTNNPSDAVLVINLLVCRLKLGIKVNQSTKLLLRLLRPKVVRTAQWIRATVEPLTVDLDDIIVELESTCIEYLLRDYDMGERAWPLHYLFGRPRGVIRGWAMKRANAIRREAHTHYQYGLAMVDTGHGAMTQDFETNLTIANAKATKIYSIPDAPETPDYGARLDKRKETERYEGMVDIIEDGVTLPLSEYRVMRFCMANAYTQDDPRPVTGLHGFLADHTGVKRRAISKYYRYAGYQLVEAAGLTESTLVAKGIVANGVSIERRARWIHGLNDPQQDRLTPVEIHGLLQAVAAVDTTPATLSDICWAYGVSDRSYYRLRDKYGGLTLKQIEAGEANDG